MPETCAPDLRIRGLRGIGGEWKLIRALKTDFFRSLGNKRMLAIVFALALFCFASAFESLESSGFSTASIVCVIQFDVLVMDAFKTIMVFLLCGLYAGSFCRDDSSHYLRMLLTRQTLKQYTFSRFFVNTAAVVVVTLAGFYVFAAYLTFFVEITGDIGTQMNSVFYRTIAMEHPYLYVGMMALQFGMVAAACSSIGLLFSAYQANAFVSIGIGGMSFFVAISFFAHGTPFAVFDLVSMFSTLPGGYETPQAVMFAWGMIYPASVTGICAFLFYRRMKWRVDNGYI